MSGHVITIERGKEFQAKEENIYDRHAFFFDAYCRAAYCVEEILHTGEQYLGQRRSAYFAEERGDRRAGVTPSRILAGYPNNIIAFCAERGQGKTSAMLSFSRALQKLNRDGDVSEEDLDCVWKPGAVASQARQRRYEVIESIDPTMMEDGESIVRVVLSRMFSHAEERRNAYYQRSYREGDEADNGAYNDLLRKFQRCFHNVAVLTQADYRSEDTDELAQIAELSDSANIRGMLFDLVESFLRYMGTGDGAYLVLQIDDADLNIKAAYQILDDIRRYLVLPHVLVLIATNMKQMESVVEQHFIGQYDKSIQNSGMVTTEQCRRIAELYLEKGIPSVRRIYLPDINNEIERRFNDITVCYMDEGEKNILDPADTAETGSGEGEERKGAETLGFQEQLLRFLYRRTGLVLLPTAEHLHDLLPGSLRGLGQFLSYFSPLEEVKINYWDLTQKDEALSEEVNKWVNNLFRLETYLVEHWAPVNLSLSAAKLLQSVCALPEGARNAHLLWALPEYYATYKQEQSGINWSNDYHKDFLDACKRYGMDFYEAEGHQRYATYSDVYTALSVLTSLPEGHSHCKLVYGIQLCYTIHMHLTLLDCYPFAEKKRGAAEDPNPLAQFLGDVLYQRKDLSKKLTGLPYGHYNVDIRSLKKLCEIGARSEEQLLTSGFGRYFWGLCRRKNAEGRTYRFVPEKEKDFAAQLRNYDNFRNGEEQLVFHMFYPCMETIEEYMEGGRASDSDPRDLWAGAVFLLLNVDVQRYLEHSLRHDDDYAHRSEKLLRGVFDHVRLHGENKVLKEVARITQEPKYSNLFEWLKQYAKPESKESGAHVAFLESSEAHRAVFAIQLCVEELRVPLVDRLEECRKCFKELNDNVTKLIAATDGDEKLKWSDKSFGELEDEKDAFESGGRGQEGLKEQLHKVDASRAELESKYLFEINLLLALEGRSQLDSDNTKLSEYAGLYKAYQKACATWVKGVIGEGAPTQGSKAAAAAKGKNAATSAKTE